MNQPKRWALLEHRGSPDDPEGIHFDLLLEDLQKEEDHLQSLQTHVLELKCVESYYKYLLATPGIHYQHPKSDNQYTCHLAASAHLDF